MALYHKYRPQTFKDLIGQDHVSQTLRHALESNKISHGYLFSGPRGSGKTTTARLLAKALNCLELKDGELCNNHCANCILINKGQALDILEIDAASNRGIDDIRDLREHVKFAPNNLKYKVVIIDEVHMLTKEAFNALLKTLEEPPNHVVFILATTEAHKVQATILSRVQRFSFKRAPVEMLAKNLLNIAKKENIQLSPTGATLLGSLSEGSFRDSVTLLDQVSQGNKELIDESNIRNILGLSDNELVKTFFKQIENNQRHEALTTLDTFLNSGGDPGNFLNQAISFTREILRSNDNPKTLNWIEGLIKASEQLKVSPLPSLPLEIFIAEQTSFYSNEIDAIKKPSIDYKISEPLASPKLAKSSSIQETKDKSVKEELLKDEIKELETIAATEEKPAKVSASHPVSDFNDQHWHQLIEELKKENTSLAAILKDSYFAGLDGNILKIAVKFKFHSLKISDRKNRSIIEQTLEKLNGHQLSVNCVVDPSFIKVEEKPKNDDLVLDALNVFEGI
jgi:DNA polymerase-3 subunit gamma/tau